MANEPNDLSKMTDEKLINHLIEVAPPGSPMTPEGEAAIKELQRRSAEPEHSPSAPQGQDDVMNMINNLPAPGTQWTPEADKTVEKLNQWKNNQDPLAPSSGCVITDTYNACADGSQQNVPQRDMENKVAPVAPFVQQRPAGP